MEDMREDKDLSEEERKPEGEEPETGVSDASDLTSVEEKSSEEEKSEETGESSQEEKSEEAKSETDESEEKPEEESAKEAEAPEEEKSAETGESSETEKSEEEKSETDESEAKSEEESSQEAETPEEEKSEGTEESSAEENPEGTAEETKEKKHYGKFIIAAAAAVVVIGGAGYIGYAQQYNTKFFPGTTVNYIDVSGLDINEVKDRLAEGVADYSLNLVTRTGDEQIAGQDIGLSMVYDDSLENWLNGQNPYMWGLHLFQDTPYTVETMVSYDPDLLDEVVENLACMDPSVMEAPVDATISEYDEATGSYSIVPEIPGTIIDKKKLTEALDAAVTSMSPDLVLADTDAYVLADITSENPDLLARLDEYNQYAGMTVVYKFGDEQEVLDGSHIHEWLTTADDGTISVDKDAVSEYVQYLAEKYDTTSQTRTLQTTYGPTVTLTKGNYGWKISQSKETDALMDIILTGQGEEREPEYQQTAVTRGEKDYGDTYVEINLTAQHLYYYKDGSLVIETDLVSGNESNGNATPDGAYYLAYKQRNAVLRGRRRADGSYEYESPVSYWMPFNGGIGLHDATWRGSFGGSIYKTNGSHGCINLPFSAAKTIFENIEAGTPVFCYRLGSTEPSKTTTTSSSGSGSSSRSSSSSSSSTATAAVQETVPDIQPIEETAPITEAVEVPAETQAPSGSSNVIVAGQSKSSQGPGSQQPEETSPVITAGASQSAEQAAEAQAAAAEAQAAAAEAQAAAAEAQAAPVEAQAAAAEAQAAPAEAQAAPAEAAASAEAAAPAVTEVVPVTADISMEAPGI